MATAIEVLLAHATLSIQEPAVVRRAVEHFRTKPALGLSDCLIPEVAGAAGHLSLGTFDKNPGKLPSAERIRT